MAIIRNISDDSKDCHESQCSIKDNSSNLNGEQNDEQVKLLIQKLPEGITRTGVTNLFLTIGKPVNIYFKPKNAAVVVMSTMKEAELAVRDLHCKPPYKLKVKILSNYTDVSERKCETLEENDFCQSVPISKSPCKYESDSSKEEVLHVKHASEILMQIKKVVQSLGYDPSIRMRQKKLDFKTNYECVSRGRGYLNMGTDDRFVDFLEKFELSSKDGRAKDEMRLFCENCSALTSKTCKKCFAPFCSDTCLNNSGIDHNKKCSSGKNGTSKKFVVNDPSTAHSIKKIPLKTGSVVIITSYFSMKTVYVRPSDEYWEEKFAKLCNDVAYVAIKGNNLEKMPKVGALVVAKYYEDLCFYRAKVQSLTEDKIDVFFIDFGNTQETNLEDLRTLPEHLKSFPEFATKVLLRDVLELSSLESVRYYNKLTAEGIPLILKFEESLDKVILIEKESKAVVNDVVRQHTMPNWKKDEYALLKSGQVYYLNLLRSQKLEIGKKYNLVLSHFDEKEFSESEVFWTTIAETDEFYHVQSEMSLRITEYCEYLKDYHYLPRANELCLAKENDEWRRCVNLKAQNTTCCVFFVDDGRSALIETSNIRKMVSDFIETPAQSICCTLRGKSIFFQSHYDPKLKKNKKFKSEIVEYLKDKVGDTMDSVHVLKLMGDAYCLSIPEMEKMLE